MKNRAMLLHHEHYELIGRLTDEEAGMLFKAFYEYDINGKEPTFPDRSLELVFITISRFLDRNKVRYEEVSKARSEAAKRRWLALKADADVLMQTDANVTKENEKENKKEKENKNPSETEIEREKENETAVIREDESAAGDQKKAYGEFQNVFLTDEEYCKLREKRGDVNNIIETLSAYMQSSGKEYNDHYAQLINWRDFPSHCIKETSNMRGRKSKECREPTFDVEEFTKKAIGLKYVPPQ